MVSTAGRFRSIPGQLSQFIDRTLCHPQLTASARGAPHCAARNGSRIEDLEPLRGCVCRSGPAGYLHANVLFPRPQAGARRSELGILVAQPTFPEARRADESDTVSCGSSVSYAAASNVIAGSDRRLAWPCDVKGYSRIVRGFEFDSLSGRGYRISSDYAVARQSQRGWTGDIGGLVAT